MRPPEHLSRLRGSRTRSISPENADGRAGAGGRATSGTGATAARDLGPGWKMSPSVDIAPGKEFRLAEIDGPARITHLWATTGERHWRELVLRAYWEGCDQPAIEVPYGDFFCNGWSQFAQISSDPIAANPFGGFNSYWPMPFQSHARVTLENLSQETVRVFFQLTFELGDVDEEEGYLHAQWRRSNPTPPGGPHVLLEGVRGQGHYVGTYLAWGSNSDGWWGEGEVKFYIDDDGAFPTICGTGVEDYVGGAWGFEVPGSGYTEYSTAYLGLPQVIRPDGLYRSQQRFGMYRWHVPDPIRFASGVRAEVQALGWRSGGRYLPLRDDIASTAVFYLDRPVTNRPLSPTADELEVHIGAGAVPEL